MRLTTPALAVAAASASLALAAPALAANPHFTSVSIVAASNYGATATFQEAGLGAGQTVTITASGTYTAVFQCLNGGGKNPTATKFTEETGSASKSGSFTATKNGSIKGSLTLAAPSTATDLATNTLVCPNGQTEKLTEVSWSVSLRDDTTGAAFGPVSLKVGQRY